jgi:hypothetical protein
MYAVLALVGLMILTWAVAVAATYAEEDDATAPHDTNEPPAPDEAVRPDDLTETERHRHNGQDTPVVGDRLDRHAMAGARPGSPRPASK